MGKTIKPFFLIGNKRSGTSLLVRLLNLHPEIFIAHESDIVWILYCLHQKRDIMCYPEDGFIGCQNTLDQAGHLLDDSATPYQNYMRVQLFLMEKGTRWLAPMFKPDLSWIGDKKPVQAADPNILSFVLKHLPEARFIHIIRHPNDWLASSRVFVPLEGATDVQMLNFWLQNERRVIDARHKVPVFSLTYSKLCANPLDQLNRIFSFLQVKEPPNKISLKEEISYRSHRDGNENTLPTPVLEFWEKQSRLISEMEKSPA